LYLLKRDDIIEPKGVSMITVDMHAHPLLDTYYIPAGLNKRRPRLPGLFGSRLSLEALRKGRVNVVVSSIYPFWSPARKSAHLQRCHDIIKLIEAYLAERGDLVSLVRTAAEIESVLAQNKIAFIHAVEGGHVLEGRLENLERLYDWGVRSLTLTHFINNDIAAAATFDPRRRLPGRNGLTSFGREVVAEMNRLGMIIDLAHSSERAFWQVMELTKDPVIVSHTGARRYSPWEVCLSDEQIKAVAKNRGVIGIIFSSHSLRRFGLGADVGAIVDHVLHVCRLAGADHVGLGSDFNGTFLVKGIKDAGDFPAIRARLEERGLSQEEVSKIMGGNFLRLFSAVV
jgi:membrane dipeptidase